MCQCCPMHTRSCDLRRSTGFRLADSRSSAVRGSDIGSKAGGHRSASRAFGNSAGSSTEPVPTVPAASTPTSQANPFAFDPSGTHSTLAERQATLPESESAPIPIEEPSDEVAKARTHRGSHDRDAAVTGGKFKTLSLVLAAYSLVVTALAVYGLFFKPTEKLDPGHPLSTIPDNFGEFDPASRRRCLNQIPTRRRVAREPPSESRRQD